MTDQEHSHDISGLRYYVVSRHSMSELMHEVNHCMDNGWLLSGGIYSTQGPDAYTGHPPAVYHQAMTNPKPIKQ